MTHRGPLAAESGPSTRWRRWSSWPTAWTASSCATASSMGPARITAPMARWSRTSGGAGCRSSARARASFRSSTWTTRRARSARCEFRSGSRSSWAASRRRASPPSCAAPRTRRRSVNSNGNRRTRPGASASRRCSAEPRHDLALVEVEEAVLIGADLVQVDVVASGVHEALDHLGVPIRVRPTSHDLRHVVLGQHARRLLEMRRLRQLLAQLPRQRDVREPLERRLLRLRLRRGPAHVALAVARPPLAAALGELLGGFRAGRREHQAVPDPSRELSCRLASRGDHHRRRRVRDGVEARIGHPVSGPAVGHQLAGPQLADDLDGLLEDVEPVAGRRPAVAEYVLVEVFPGPDAKEEAALHHHRGGGARVGDDRRVHPNRRAGDARPEAQPLGGLGNAAYDGPYERALTLTVDPRMKVIGDEGEREPRLLRPRGVADELRGPVLLAGQGIAELWHGALLPEDHQRDTV